MSDEESELNDASQSEEQDESDGGDQPSQKQKQPPPSGQLKKTTEIANEKQKNKTQNKNNDTATKGAAAASSNAGKASPRKKPKKGKEKESDSQSGSSSSGSQQATGVSSGAPVIGGGAARMTFDGGAAISDDEVNSWEEEVSESDGSLRGDDYYDQEDYDEESPSPRKEPEETKEEAGAAAGEEEYGSEDEGGRLVMNLYCTEYEVIRKVARKVHGFKIREYPEDHDGAIRKGEHSQKLVKEWDVSWHDLSVTPDFLAKLNPYQKVNHYPGMYAITRKNHLARNLMRMKRAFPAEFDFFPATWVLPGDNIDFRNQFAKTAGDKKQKRQTYIVKPDGLSQGKGIFLSRRMETILSGIETGTQDEGIGGWVVQHYLDQPHLVDDLKYDLRIYVLLNSVNPLRVYIHEEGLARFCTEPYRKPTARNMDNLFMHLTNYAINKLSSAYQAGEESSGDEEGGHKRSLTAIMNILEACGADKEKLMREIKDIIVKTLATSQPYLAHLYRSCQPEDLDCSMCFQILGFDVMIDKDFKPWLIEVNQSPSFATDSPLDYKCKKAVLTDTFRLLNCSVSKRKRLLKQQRAQMESRILTGKQAKMDPDEKVRVRAQKLAERDAYEAKRRGQWELIYPWPEEERNETYGHFIKKAQEIWDEFTTGKGKRVSMEDRRSQNNSNAQNLNRQGTGKAAINPQRGGAGGLANQGSSTTLRTVNHKNMLSNRTAGSSTKDLTQSVLTQNIHGSKASMTQHPPHSSAGYANKNKISSDRVNGNFQQHQSIGQLEVIHQASQEGGSPQLAKFLQANDSAERLPMMGSQGRPFKLNLMQSPTSGQQNYAQLVLNGPAAKPGQLQQEQVADHLQRLTRPTNLNQPPVADVKQQYQQSQKQANQIMIQLEDGQNNKIQMQQYHGYNVQNSGAGSPGGSNKVSGDSRLTGQKTTTANESKMSFINRQLEAHQRGHDQYDQLQQQAHRSREKWINDESQNKRSQYNDSHISMDHRPAMDTGVDKLQNPATQTKFAASAGKDSLRIKQQNARQMQKELELFQNSTNGQSGKHPAKLYRKGSKDAIRADHLTSNTNPSVQARRSPLQQKTGSAEGRQSLQNAGSEQMNFLIATNYSTAKTNLEQYKQQIPQWAIKEGAATAAAIQDHQSRVNQYQTNSMKDSKQQLAQFSSTWKNSGLDPANMGQQQAPDTLNRAKIMQQKQLEMTQQTYENLKKANAVTPDLNQIQMQHLTKQHVPSQILTEQKKQSAYNQQNLLSFDENIANRKLGTTIKQPSSQRNDEMQQQQQFESQTQFLIKESSDFSQMGQRIRLDNAAGSSGLPQVSSLHNNIKSLNTAANVEQQPLKPPQKQAVKMTQMPIFLAETTVNHRMVVRKKETPKMKFKALPGIQNSNVSSIHSHKQPDKLMKQSIHNKGGSKTLVKQSQPKLDSIQKMMQGQNSGQTNSRFESNSVQVNKTGMPKPMPTYSHLHNNYQGVVAAGADPDEQQYFQRRQAFQNSEKSHLGTNNKASRVIQGGLPISHQPLKNSPNLNQLQVVSSVSNTTGVSGGPNSHHHSYPLPGSNDVKPQPSTTTNTTAPQRRVEILTSGEQPSSQQQHTVPTMATMTVASTSAAITGAVEGGNIAVVHQQQQHHNQAHQQQQKVGVVSQSNNNHNLTPFQLYQQQQQQQQQRRCGHQQPAPYSSQQLPLGQHSSSYQYHQQQVEKGVVVGVAAGNGPGVAGGALHNKQQNQFILQKSNNNQRQQYLQHHSQQNNNNWQQQQQPENSSSSAATHKQQKPQHQQQSQQVASQQSEAQHQEHHRGNTSQFEKIQMASGPNFFRQQQSSQQQHQSALQHQTKVPQNTTNDPTHQSQPRKGTSRGGSGFNNRRLGRALGQGKSMGANGSHQNNNLHSNKSRGLIGGAGSGVAYGGNVSRSGAHSQFPNRAGKASLALSSTFKNGSGAGAKPIISRDQQQHSHHQQAVTQNNWQRSSGVHNPKAQTSLLSSGPSNGGAPHSQQPLSQQSYNTATSQKTAKNSIQQLKVTNNKQSTHQYHRENSSPPVLSSDTLKGKAQTLQNLTHQSHGSAQHQQIKNQASNEYQNM